MARFTTAISGADPGFGKRVDFGRRAWLTSSALTAGVHPSFHLFCR